MRYLASGLSLQMLPQGGRLEVERVGPLQEGDHFNPTLACGRLFTVETHKGPTPYYGSPTYRTPAWGKAVIGHEGTAQELTRLLGVPVSVSREAITLETGDTLWVAQPTGKRIEYGRELDAPALTLFEVRVKGSEPPCRRAHVEEAGMEVLVSELWDRDERHPGSLAKAESRVRAEA